MYTEVTTPESKALLTLDLRNGENQTANMQQQQSEQSSDQNIYDKNDRQKKRAHYDNKEYQNLSPRRITNSNSNNNNNSSSNSSNNHNNNNRYNNNNNRMSNYHNGNRQNRNNQQQQLHRLDTNNNNNSNSSNVNGQKMQNTNNTYQNNFNISNNNNGKSISTTTLTPNTLKSDYPQEISNGNLKKPVTKHRINNNNNNNNKMTNNQTQINSNVSPNYDYEDYTNRSSRLDTAIINGDKNISDDSGINLNTSVPNGNSLESRLKYDQLMGGDNDSLNRKYSMDFLHHVGHQYKISTNTVMSPKTPTQHSPKILDDANLIALKMALGDNSGYYNFYGQGVYTNQLFFQTQQHQQYQQNYARMQQQHLQQQQQRMRMVQRQDSTNYQRVYQQPQQQQSQQQNTGDQQRTFHNGYYPKQQHQQHYNSFQYQNNNRLKQNRDRKNHQNNSTNNERNVYNNSNNKRLNEQQNARILHTKSDGSAQIEEHKQNKNLMYIRTNSEEYRSLSPTPPSSVKSSSPGIQDVKTCDTKETMTTEFNDDSESTASSTHSVISYSSDNNNNNTNSSIEHPLTPTILLTSTDNMKQNVVNTWINNNNFTPINNGLSISAEQLNFRAAETPIIIKRPPSANGINGIISPPPTSGISTTPTNHNHSIPRNYTLPTYDPTCPFDYYFARGERCEIREEPMNLSCGSSWDHVSHEIWDKFQIFQQTRETYQNKMILWRDLYEYIRGFPLFQQRACPKWGLFLVGSTISGFGLDSSDVDMCLVLKSAPQLDPRTEAMITLSTLKNYLINSGSTFQGYYLINAKVPILRFRDSTNTIEVDLNYNNCIGVRNTHLLYCYAQLDWRLRPLAIIVKLWAQYHNINDARNSTISSYSLVLMVIHFLQSAVSPAVLPCLHKKYPEKFQVLHDITTIDMMECLETDWKSDNYQSLGELFLRFLDYYSNFDYVKYAISIRTGGVLPIEECRSVKTPKNDPNHWQTLCIEEPFDLTNTARSTYDGEIFEKIKNVFFQSWRILREHKTLESLFQDQLFIQQTATQQAHQLYCSINNQMLNDPKFGIYSQMSSLPIITNQMNSEIIS